MILTCQGDWYRCLTPQMQNMSNGDDFVESSWIFILVPFLATWEALAPLSNDHIMLGRLICSYRHLEHQNLSVIADSIDWERCGKIFSYEFGGIGATSNDPIMSGRSIW